MTWPPSTSAAVVRQSTLGGLVVLSQCCTAADMAPPGVLRVWAEDTFLVNGQKVDAPACSRARGLCSSAS